VLEKGKVKEIGSHHELLQIKDGHYKDMVDTAYALNG
jgi:ABC-type multidrug transport system fused ATPase/permease subunit